MKKILFGLSLLGSMSASNAFAATGIIELFSNQANLSGQISFTANDVATSGSGPFSNQNYSTSLTTSQAANNNGLYATHVNTGLHFDQDPTESYNSSITNAQLTIDGQTYNLADSSWSGKKNNLLYIDIFYDNNGNAFADCKNQETYTNGMAQCSESIDGTGNFAYATFLSNQ